MIAASRPACLSQEKLNISEIRRLPRQELAVHEILLIELIMKERR